jgi:hypothetical protein
MSETLNIKPDYQALLAAHELRDLPAFFEQQQGERLDKPGLEPWRQRWRITLSDTDGDEQTFYLKRFTHPPLNRQIDRWKTGQFARSTAAVEFDNAHQLAAAGITAIVPVAFGQQMAGPWEKRSFLLMGEVTGESLERWVPLHLSPPDSETDRTSRRNRLDRLADFIARFHNTGFVHRDLYLSHVFIRTENDGAATFALIDLQRVFRPSVRKRRWAIKDLAALDFSTPADRVSRTERLRFLCRYARICQVFGSARSLARSIQRKTNSMRRRQNRHRRSKPKANSG